MDNLPDLDGLARTLPADQLPDFLGRLATAQGINLSRLLTPAPSVQSDELLTIEEGAHVLAVSKEYLYRHSAQLPFIVRQGRALRCSRLGLQTYLKRRTR